MLQGPGTEWGRLYTNDPLEAPPSQGLACHERDFIGFLRHQRCHSDEYLVRAVPRDHRIDSGLAVVSPLDGEVRDGVVALDQRYRLVDGVSLRHGDCSGRAVLVHQFD